MTDAPASSGPQELVARAGRYYRNARYILVAAMVVVGLWFAYDGWVTYPAFNRRFDSLTPEQRAGEKHTRYQQLDIDIQRALAIALISATVPMLAWFHYRSRGAYRLSGTTLHVPGHPPVPFEAIIALDKAKWERKGIAFIDYELEGARKSRRLTLDDFVYARGPTDEIVARVEQWLKTHGATGEGESAGEGGE